ncbi:MAG: hypothetical protein PHV13_01995 [Candidatus ainarchaeum sp.]|nr:hypothetical protein [Candidatus ainarchaeum sp.]
MKTAPKTETDVGTQKQQLITQIREGYKPASDSAQQLARNTVQAWETLKLLWAGTPAKTDIAGTSLYNSALALGTTGTKVDKNAAILKLQDAHIRMMIELSNKLTGKADAGADSTALLTMLSEIDKGLKAGDARYDAYDAYLGQMAKINLTLRGAATKIQVSEKTKSSTSEGLLLIPPPQRYEGALFVNSARTNSTVWQFGDPQTPGELADKAGVDNARNIMRSFTNVQQQWANDENFMSSSAAPVAARDLYTALSRIPSTDDLWQSGSFRTAMQQLQSGNLAAGLALLGNETVFNNPEFRNAINNLFTVMTNPKAFTTMRYGLKCQWNFDENQQMFKDEITRTKKPKGFMTFQPVGLYAGLALHYSMLGMSGQYARMQYDPTATGSPLTATGDRGVLTGRGHAVEATGTWGEGIGFFGQPMEIKFNLTGGYKTWGLNGIDRLLSDGTTLHIPAQSYNQWYLSLAGLEINFWGTEGDRTRFMLLPPAKVGGQIRPAMSFEQDRLVVSGIDWLGYITFSASTREKNSWRVTTLLTPEISSLMNELRVGGQLTPAQFARTTEKFMLQLDATVSATKNLKTAVSTLEASANTRYVGRVVDFPLDLLVRAGYTQEIGGAKADRVPGGLFVNVENTFQIGKSPLSGLKPKKK